MINEARQARKEDLERQILVVRKRISMLEETHRNLDKALREIEDQEIKETPWHEPRFLNAPAPPILEEDSTADFFAAIDGRHRAT